MDIYTEYKYPKPLQFYGLEIPIEKGYAYVQTDNVLNIYHPYFRTYSISIVRNFKPSAQIPTLKELLLDNNEMVIKVDSLEQDGIKYQESFSVDRTWVFKITIFFPNKNILISFKGAKIYHNKFEKFITFIIHNFASYQAP